MGLPPIDSLLQAGGLLAAPIFFACLTDAAGFAALMTSQVGPVHDFGLMMAIGSLMVLVSVTLAVPGIVLLGQTSQSTRQATGEQAISKLLDQLLHWSRRHARLIVATSVLASGFAIYGSTRLERETDFTRNFRQDSQLVQGYQFVSSVSAARASGRFVAAKRLTSTKTISFAFWHWKKNSAKTSPSS